MAETAFSEDGKYYSAISTDGRLKIWDTETNELKQQYTPDLHLTSPPSCLHWLTITVSAGQTPKQKKKRTSTNENESQCIALGTHSGKILLYSVAQAKIDTILSSRSFSKVAALDWSRDYGLYSVGKDDLAIEWDIQEGKPRNQYKIAVENKSKQGNSISAIKIVPHKLETEAHYLVAASWQVRLWRLYKGEACIVKTFGHNASQTALLSLARVNDVCWLIEGSQNERLLSFWDITISEDHDPLTNGDEPTPKKQKRRKKSLTNIPTINTPTYNFVLEDAPRMVCADLTDAGGVVRLSLAAATRSGVVHYYAQTLNGSSVKPTKPLVTIQASTQDAVPIPLTCCRLQHSGDLLLGSSDGPNMTFENVTPDVKTKTQVLIRGPTKTSQKTNDVSKVRTDTHKNTSVHIVEPMGGVASRKRVVPGGQIEVPMEARLSNLSLDPSGRKQTAVNENFTKLLVQGLHSKDKEIIRTVLLKNRLDVAISTVSALPAEYVPALLHELAEMAARKTTNCLRVCTWLTALVRTQSALLLALMNSSHSEELTHLHSIFTNRRSHLCQLMNLKGRLNLTIRQRDAAKKHNKDRTRALLQYKDASSDEELVMNERARSESEGSWDDDKFADKSDDDSSGSGDDSDDSDDDDSSGSGDDSDDDE